MNIITETITTFVMVLLSLIISLWLQTPFILWSVIFVVVVALMWRWA